MPAAFSLSLTGRTSALRYVKTSVINSRLAVSSSTTRSFSGVMHLTFLLSCFTITRVRGQHVPQHTSLTGSCADGKHFYLSSHTLSQAALLAGHCRHFGRLPTFPQPDPEKMWL